MKTVHTRRTVVAACCATLTALTLGAAGVTSTAAASSSGGPVVSTDSGAVRGEAVSGTFAFRGLPYAAAPTGNLRWRPPQPAPRWQGVRDATEFGPSCPQPTAPFPPAGRLDEDCLYLNVSTPTQRSHAKRPVLVWIHGGGLTQDGARNYDGTKLAAEGTVVVTINYRLGALGFLAHPALASRPGGPNGNYGLMDQQAALRWVQHNVGRFGGDPRNVTIAGESAGGLSVLAHLVSSSSRGLFQKAIVQSGAFALTQQSLAEAEAFGTNFAALLGCAKPTPKLTADCLRRVPATDLVDKLPASGGALIPGVVDGRILTESIGTALAAGRFNRVPVLNGSNHDEERIFIQIGRAISNGFNVPAATPTPETYQTVIADVMSVSAARAATIAAEYPVTAYPTPLIALSMLVGDANFACTALQTNAWTARRGVPTFGYEFNDDTAPFIFAPAGFIDVATHGSEIPYVLDEPGAPFPVPLNADQQALATDMRAAWANFAARGNPSTADTRWPSFDSRGRVTSLDLPAPQLETDFAARHHCSFWAAG